jgi:hypothetical protein
MPRGALEADAIGMHPWIAEQANKEHIAELRSLNRPFRVPLVGRTLGRQRVARPQPKRSWRGVSRRRGRLSVRF